MTMKSVNLLPSLRELPGQPTRLGKCFREVMTDLVGTDRTFYAAENSFSHFFRPMEHF